MASSYNQSANSQYIAYPNEKQKRKKARIQVSFNGSIEIPGRAEEPCMVTSLGTGGLTVSSRASFYPGELIRIKFKLNDKDIRAEGEIVRVTGKEVGVKFIEISTEELDLIQTYIFKNTFNRI